jgi:hypothetical protein
MQFQGLSEGGEGKDLLVRRRLSLWKKTECHTIGKATCWQARMLALPGIFMKEDHASTGSA